MNPQGNIHPTGPRNAKIAVVIDAPSAQDVWASRPLANTAGEAFSQLLQQAGLLRTECYITALMRYRPLKDEISRFATSVKAEADRFALTEREAGLYIHPKMREFRSSLQEEMRLLSPTVIITLGPYSTWALTDVYGPTATWRGSQLQCTVLPEATVIPTYHPADLFRQFDQRGLAIRDLLRAHCVARQPHLYREPRYNFTISPSLSQVLGYLEDCLYQLKQGELKISCDIETIAYYISCVGLALNAREAICIPFMSLEGHYWSAEEELLIHVKLREVLTHPNAFIIGQNFNYDNQHFATEFGYLANLANLGFDTLYAQQVLLPGTKKSLDTLSSLYCHWHRYWKDENKDYAKLPDDMSLYWRYNCLSGATPVLDAYCRWRPLADIRIGDSILTFEENAGQRGTRKLIYATVTNRASSHKQAMRVVFTDGTCLEGTPEHRVIAQEPTKYRRNSYNLPEWKKLEDLQPGDALPHVPDWQQSKLYEDGWVAGLVDGEGTLGHHSQGSYKSICISISQKEGLVAERLRRGLHRHAFEWNEADKHGVIYFGIRGGLSEQLRFLGIFETDRLQCTMLSLAINPGFGGSQQLPKKIVKESHRIGTIEVFDISTTAGTFLTSSGIAHNCKDTVTTFEIHLAQQELIAYYGKEKQLRDLHRMGAAALRSMLRGVRIDTLLRSHVAEQLMAAIEQYTALIHQFAGFPLNVSSTPQMQKLFYEDLNLPVQVNRKTHRPSLDGDALQALAKIEPIIKPFIEVIELRRQLGTFLKTYCMMKLGTDGRMRCTYNVAGTETFRFSSSADAYGTGGNLQNLSTGDSDE